jgi:RNase adapter protein RapZ
VDNMRFILITGLSGAGKSQAIQSLEDLGYFCVDNLPPTLIPKFAELCTQSGDRLKDVALVCDIRGGEFFSELFHALNTLEDMGLHYEILYLEARDEVLIRRYKETRRRHPLASHGSISEGIKKEKRLLEEIRGNAHKIIDTSNFSPQELKKEITKQFSRHRIKGNILVTVVSFGFKYGLPLDADLVLDVRFLPNPHYVPSLQPLTGQSPDVQKYVHQWSITGKFLKKTRDLLEFLLPCYIKEGKSQLVVAVGCTGGKHRSVVIGERLADFIASKDYQVTVEHRDMDKS